MGWQSFPFTTGSAASSVEWDVERRDRSRSSSNADLPFFSPSFVRRRRWPALEAIYFNN
jgi:hypothetical protein